MPDVTSGSLSGGRAATSVSGGTGYRLDRDGVHFAAGVLGDLASTNFVPGSSGWRLRANGSAELDAAAIRGTLSADHIDSDVQNWVGLYNGSGFSVSPGSTGNRQLSGLGSLDALCFSNTVLGYTIPSAVIPLSRFPVSTSPSLLVSWATGSDSWLSRSGNSIYYRHADGHPSTCYAIWGVKYP